MGGKTNDTNLKDSVKKWKENVPLESKGFLTWENELVFTARIRGYEFEYDPKAAEGCFPTDTFLMSVAGCLAIDVVMFLKKMRAENGRKMGKSPENVD